MRTEQILRELEDVAQRLGVEVRVERGGFRGGLCQIDDEQVIVLNKRQPVETRLAVADVGQIAVGQIGSRRNRWHAAVNTIEAVAAAKEICRRLR